MKSQSITVDDHGNKYTALKFWCPGCSGGLDTSVGPGLHMLPVNSPNKQPSWTWDGNEEAPTLSPSILSKNGVNVCHSFLRAGVFEFLPDCTHQYAGQQVPMVDLPEWAVKDFA